MKYKKLLLFPIIAISSVAHAQTFPQTISVSQTGWVDATGFGLTSNSNYLAGEYEGTEYRNYFEFDLSGVLGLVTEATLNITAPTGAFSSPNAAEILGISLVETDLDFSASSFNDVGIFSELGNGNFVGTSIISSSPTEDVISIVLNQDFINRANSNGIVTLGGSVLSLDNDSSTTEYVFGNTFGTQNGVTLDVIVDPNGTAVPEPSSSLLLSLAGLTLIIKRKR